MRPKHMRRRMIGTAAVGVLLAGSAAAFAVADGAGGNTARSSASAAIKHVPARIAGEFPALRKALLANEAQQLPMVAKVMGTLESHDEPAEIGGANSALARRISQDGDNSEYVVPGNEVVCMVAISSGAATGGGCAPASAVESTGTTSLTVVPGGYEVSGILPTGTSDVSITDVSGQTTAVTANSNHAFEFFSAAPLKRLTYALPNGTQHEGSLELPPAPTG
jgi:hypothetical protein